MSIVSEIDKKIDEWVLQQWKTRKLQKPNYYSPSRIINCYRRQHFEREMKKEADIRLKEKALVGEIIHEHYIFPAIRYAWPDAIVLKTERDLTIAVDWEREIFIHGRADGLVHLSDPKMGRFVVEVKTVANLFAAKADIFDYKAQIMPYYVGLVVEKGFLIIVSRSTGARRTYRIDYDHEIMKWVVDRVLTSYGYYERGELPPAEGLTSPRFRKNMARGKIKFWQCSYCEYSKECAVFEEKLRTDE